MNYFENLMLSRKLYEMHKKLGYTNEAIHSLTGLSRSNIKRKIKSYVEYTKNVSDVVFNFNEEKL